MKKIKSKFICTLSAMALMCAGFLMSCSDGSSSGHENDKTQTPEVTVPSEPGKITLKINDGQAVEYESLTAALAAIPSISSLNDKCVISLGKGTYAENALTYSKNAALVIEGDTDTEFGRDVLIAGTGSSQASMSTRNLFYVTGSADVTLKNVTFKNTTVRANVTETNSSGNKLTQAEALSFCSSGKLTAYNSAFVSHQDTLYTRSRTWFYKCYVEGDVDFVWMNGDAVTALYEECTIKMTGDETNAAYVAAPGLSESSPVGKGTVFLNSKIIADDSLNGAAYLTRTPWSSGYYSQAAYIGCTFEGNINSNIWYGSAIEEGIDDENVGWKIDSASAISLASLGCNTSKVHILSKRMTEREYNGRYVILNRVFNTNTSKWETLIDRWDPDSEADFGQTEDSSKNNIFVDYADINDTGIGAALTVSDYDGEVTGAQWSAEVYSDIDLTESSSEIVSVADDGTTSTQSSANIYVKVKAQKNGAADYVIVYRVTAVSIAISDQSASVAEGSEKQLTVSFEPFGASAEVEWSSSDEEVASVDQNGLVSAKAGQSGKTAVITATVKDNSSLSVQCTVTITEAAVLKKFGTSVAGLENYNDYTTFGASDVLLYPVAVDPSASASKTWEISAKITYTAVANGGAGFVSFKDGAYSDGAMRSYAWATPAGVKSFDGTSGHGQGYDKDYRTYANAAGEYTVKAWTKKDGYLYFSITNSDGVELVKNSKTDYYVPSANDYIYLAVGGAAGMSVNSNDITVTVSDSDGEQAMKVSKFEDLTADTRTALSAESVTSSYTLNSANSTGVKGSSETIVLANIDLPSATTGADGNWVWDEVSAVYSGSGDLTVTASFIPSDRETYKAILSQEVTVAVTDEREEGKQYVYNVIAETFTAAGDLQNSVNNTYYSDGTHGNVVVDTLTYTNTTEKDGGTAATGKMSKGAGAHQTRNTVLYIPIDESRISDSAKASIVIPAASWANSNVYGGSASNKLTAESNTITYTFSSGELVTKTSETSAGANASVTAAMDEDKAYAKIIIRHNGGDSYFKSITLTYTDTE
jgi:hypothetical protein